MPVVGRPVLAKNRINAGFVIKVALLDLGPTLLRGSFSKILAVQKKGHQTRNKYALGASGHQRHFATPWEIRQPCLSSTTDFTIEPRITEIQIAIALA